jgi:ribosome production factor 1
MPPGRDGRDGPARSNPGQIKNKMKRKEVMAKVRVIKKKQKRSLRDESKRKNMEAVALGEEPVRKKPRTQENTRINDATFVGKNDQEVFGDEAGDEFAKIFANCETPKIMITTRPRPSKNLFRFVGDLMQCVPKAYYYPRKSFDVKEICGFAANKKFTHLIVLGEKSKVCNGMLVSRLPEGPTAFFKVSNVQISTDLDGHGRTTSHTPEVILNNFNTRLGRRVGRFLGSMFSHSPEFVGRQVVTFHNQRDFIFVRHHRYVFDREDEDARARFDKVQKRVTAAGQVPLERAGCEAGIKTKLQELGPRFTLKLRWLQQGTFDTLHGEYEWLGKRGGIGLQEKRTQFSL